MMLSLLVQIRCEFVAACLGLVLLPLSATADDAISPTRVIPLFNGISLENLETWLKDEGHDDPRQVFRVTEGMLHITGDGLGAVITRDRYRDYHLVLEYKWGDRTWRDRRRSARDSGLLIHSNGKLGGYAGTWMPSIEVQIIEGGVGDFVFVPGDDEAGQPVPLALTASVGRDRDDEVIWKQNGRRETFGPGNYRRINWYGRDPDWKDEIGFRGRLDKDNRLGEWTRIDVLADGGHIEVFVNGTKVNEAFDASPTAGRIQLQSELAEIFFRRWELWPLDKLPLPSVEDSPHSR
jgi:hypothetical protein